MDAINCPICFNPYECEGLHSPLIIPVCGHTICQDCLSKLKSRYNGNCQCPFCKRENTTKEFPKNYALIDLLQQNVQESITSITLNLKDESNPKHNIRIIFNEIVKQYSAIHNILQEIVNNDVKELANKSEMITIDYWKQFESTFKLCKISVDEILVKENTEVELLKKFFKNLKNEHDSMKMIFSIKKANSELGPIVNKYRNNKATESLFKLYNQTESRIVKLNEVFEATKCDLCLMHLYHLKLGIIGRSKVGKTALTHTLIGDINFDDFENENLSRAPVYKKMSYNYKDKTFCLDIVDFPGYDANQWSINSYEELIKTENCDFLVILFDNNLTDSDLCFKEFIENEFKDKQVKCYLVKSKADQAFINTFKRVHKKKFDFASQTITEGIADSLKLMKRHLNAENVYLIANSFDNMTKYEFDLELFKNDLYEDTYQLTKVIMHKNIDTYTTKILNGVRQHTKLNLYIELTKAFLGSMILNLDLVFKNRSKDRILKEFGIDKKLKEFIIKETNIVLPDTMKSNWFKGLSKELFKLRTVLRGTYTGLSYAALAGVVIIGAGPIGIGVTCVGGVALLAGAVYSCSKTSNELVKFIDNTCDDMIETAKQYTNTLLN